MSETDFNKQVQDLVEAHGGYIVKTITSNKSGVSDMLACINGRFCALEGKLDYNKRSTLQVVHHHQVIKAGGLAKQVKTLEDVLQVIYWAKAEYKQTIDSDEALPKFSL